jgi:hypothetical protein
MLRFRDLSFAQKINFSETLKRKHPRLIQNFMKSEPDIQVHRRDVLKGKMMYSVIKRNLVSSRKGEKGFTDGIRSNHYLISGR